MMKTDKKILKSASLVAGALITTSLAGAPSAGPDILAYNDLGSGAQVRSHLIDVNTNQLNGDRAAAFKFGELKWGEGKCGEGKKEAKKEGDDKAKKGASKATEAKATESKAAESKCGEGKCGEG